MSGGAAPTPQGRYRTASVCGDLAFSAGMTPRRDGVLVATGTIGAEIGEAEALELVALATANAFSTIETALPHELAIERCVRLVVYLVCAPGFTAHSAVADAASAAVAARLGADAIGARTTVGVHSLPAGAPCEVELTVALGPPRRH